MWIVSSNLLFFKIVLGTCVSWISIWILRSFCQFMQKKMCFKPLSLEVVYYMVTHNYYTANPGLFRYNPFYLLKIRHLAKWVNVDYKMWGQSCTGNKRWLLPFCLLIYIYLLKCQWKLVWWTHDSNMHELGPLCIVHLNRGSEDLGRDVPEHIW